MKTMTVEEVQAHFVQLIYQLAPGEEVLVTESFRPVAKIIGQGVMPRKPRRPGSAKGRFSILVEDDEHLDDFAEYMD